MIISVSKLTFFRKPSSINLVSLQFIFYYIFSKYLLAPIATQFFFQMCIFLGKVP